MENIKFAVNGADFAVERAVNEVKDFILKNGGRSYSEYINYFDGSIYWDNKGNHGMEYNIGELSMPDNVDRRLGIKQAMSNIFKKYLGSGIEWFVEVV